MSDHPYQLLPPLSPEDYAALEEDIIARGVLVPVEYDEAGNILDGHHRVAICESLGLVDWPRFVRKGLSEEEKRAHARALNLSRRHLTSAQKREIIEAQLKETPSISSRAIAARMGVHHSTVSNVRKQLEDGGEISHQRDVIGRDGVRQPVARPIRTMFLPERANVRELKTVAKAIRDQERETSRKVRTGLINEIAARGRVTAGRMPRAAFAVGYADPPWEQEAWSDETGQDRGLMYPPMPLDEIKALCAGDDSPFTPDAILFLWVPTNRLDDGIDVLKAWGFDFVSAITWDKVHIGLGRWVRDRTEHLLIGKRGAFPGLLPGSQPHSLHVEVKAEHSRKPVWFAEEIDRLFPDMRKLELFQRKASLADGDVRLNGLWDFWGFEAGDAAAGKAVASLPQKIAAPAPIARDATVDVLLFENAPVAIGVSGGKDSQAAALATFRHLDAIGHTGPRILVHADLGSVEWKDSLHICEELASHLQCDLVVVRRKAGGLMERWESRWVSSKTRYESLSTVTLVPCWSTPDMRFCTSEQKTHVITAELKRRFKGQTIVNVTGVRREESRNRARMQIADTDATGRIVSWRPIMDLTTEDVFAMIDASGMRPHPAYRTFGMTRVSCRWCIMSSMADMVAATKQAEGHDLYRQMVTLEIDSGFAFQGSRWLGDVAPHLLSTEQQEGLQLAKQKAVLRKEIESAITKPMFYVKGWPTRMLTDDEADILAGVRRDVTGLYGFEPRFLDRGSIHARYAELIEARAGKAVAS